MVSPEKLCFHCGNPANEKLNDVHCKFGFGILHCDNCVEQCEECKEFFCSDMKETEDGLKLCEECYKEQFESLIIKISESVCEGLGKLGYWFTGERHLDSQVIFEFTNSDLPTIEVRFDTKLKGVIKT